MITHFAELHEYVHDGEEVGLRECIFRLVIVDVLVVEQALPTAKIALNDVFDFLRQLLFYISLHTAKQEGTQD